MKLLAFDTSSQALSVALLEDGALIADLTLTVKKNHSISLMPTIEFLMAQASWNPSDLERIVVAQGPGSYTGLRVAVATAKTLAYTLDVDLVGVSSLLALVGRHTHTSGVMIPLMDARRNNVYAGFYNEKYQLVEPEGHASVLEVIERARAYSDVTFVGEVDGFKEQIIQELPDAKILPSLPSASFIGRLGAALPVQDVDRFVPNYLKRVEAEENWLKDHEEDGSEAYIKRV